MADVTVAQFADVLKVPVDKLLTQLDEAGIKVSGSGDTISEDAKLDLLTHLRRSHGQQGSTSVGAAPRRITLKRKERSELRLAGAQGRSRTVNVEVRSKHTYIKRDVLEEQAQKEQDALDQKRQEEQDRIDAEKRAAERVVAEKEEAAKRVEEEKQRAVEAQEQAETAAREEKDRAIAVAAEEKTRQERAEADARERRSKEKEKKKGRGADTRYGRKELHVAGDRAGRRKRSKVRPRRRPVSVGGDGQHGFEKPTAPVIREVEIGENIAVSELAQRMAVKGNEVVKVLFNMGAMVTINQVIDQDTAILVVEELGHSAKPVSGDDVDENLLADEQPEGDQAARAPVVTIMGHVDHGKTSLLDYIRKAKVVSGEAGGITQHVGAYHVETDKGAITFLDTPGHAAFTAMRARGAQATDIVILVVAADDGVKPQTIEAIKHANAAEVPIVVAINKIDKENADLERVKNELSAQEVISEEWGGDHLFVYVSAQTGEGIDKLLETILLQADVMDLQAVDKGPAQGLVIESSLEKGRGAVATLLVQAGTLKQGDMIIAGQEYGRVRGMFDETNQKLSEAGPSTPVVVLGLSKTPDSGDSFLVVKNERKAREVAEFRQNKFREAKLAQQQASRMEDMFTQMTEADGKVVPVVIKADVHGSVEALRDALTNISNDEVKVKVISSGVGGITESDAVLAAASHAAIIGFNVRADSTARTAMKESGVDIRYYSIIYEAIDDVKAAVSGLLAPEIRENILGLAEVKEVFTSPKLGDIAGCIVSEGLVKRANPIRVLRDNVVIFEGELESLRRFKDNVNEVRSGTECGIGVKNYNDVKVGDQIECFERIEVARTLD
ncbi:MAG: translation initiation factor IF-2 [Gammaproteobacteria bacterium]|nr:translation initiation factor IF-2 [Gammaproteobacteria bacterium]